MVRRSQPDRVLPGSGCALRQPAKPGTVIPAPSIVNGMNPLPADQLPGPTRPHSDPLAPPGSGTVQCTGQQPAPCSYTPSAGPPALYNPQNGRVVGPDGVKYSVENSTNTGDDGWKEMLAPSR